jgi:hypothetical protein
MSNKSKIVNFLSQANWKAFLFFTSFTFLLWLILQFTKTHKVEYEIRIEFIDVPVREVLSVKEVKLSSTMQQSGFYLFKKQFTDSKVSLPLSRLIKKDSSYVFQSSLFNSEIADQLMLASDEFMITNAEIEIPFQTKASKKVPLLTNFKINYAKSFTSYEGIQISQDSIKIAGPSDEIATISAIETEEVILKDLIKDKSGKVSLKKSYSDAVILAFDEVEFTVEVEKFTEQSFSLPIQLKNAPEDYEVVLLPDRVMVKFQSSLEDMENINEDDFLIEGDFNSALNEASLLIPKLVKKPNKAIRIQLEPNRIEYILRK